MIKKYSILSLFLSILIIQVSNAQHDDIRLELQRIIMHDTEISLDDTPGFIVGIIDRDSTFIFDFGNEGKGDSGKIETNTLFEIGSLSKLFTAGLVIRLEEQELLSIKDAVNSHLPVEYQNPRLAELTIQDLLSHQSGFPKRPAFFGKKDKAIQDPYAYYSRKDLMDFYREYVPITDIGTFRYSHTNYGILELIVEKITKTDFEDALKKYVLDPLELNSTFIALPEDSAAITIGHDRSLKTTKPWSFNSFAASEGIKSNMDDLVRFTKAQMEEDNLLFSSLSKTQQPLAKTDFNDQTFVGLAWHIIKSKKWYNVLTHSGMTSGHHAYITCVPETKTGVIILSNSVVGTQDLSFLILRMINYNWDRKA